MEQNENQYTSGTNLNGVKSSQVSLEPPKRKVNKGLIIVAVLLAITAVLGGTVLVTGPRKVMNQLQKTFKTEEDYYAWLERKNTEGILETLCSDDGEESSITADINLMLGSSLANLLSFKDPIQIHTEINQKNQQIQGQLQLTYKDSDLGKVSAFMNKKDNSLFIQIPNLTQKYVTMELPNKEIDTKVLGTNKLPKLTSKYLETLIEDTNVTLKYEKEDELTIGSTTLKGNVIRASYPLKETIRNLAKLCITMKSDQKLQESCEEVGITKAVYRQSLDELSTMLNEKAEDIEDADRMLFICYVDDTGAIFGRRICFTIDDTSYMISYIITDKTIAVSISLNDMEYLIAECDYSKKNKSNEFETVTKEQALTLKEYRTELGTDFVSDFLSQLLNKLGLSKSENLIFSTLGIINRDAGKFEFTLGEYKGLTVTVEETPITSDAVDQAVEDFVKYDSKMLPITDREDVEKGDYVNIDFIGKVDGKDFKNNTAEDYEIKVGDNQFLDGFDEQLIGKKVGETVKVTVTLPSTYPDTSLAGKEAEFTVTINAIGVREFTDEFVAYNSDFSSTDAYWNYAYENLQEQKEYNDQSAEDDAILQKILANSVFVSVNQSEIDAKEKEMQETYQQYADYYGVDMESLASNGFGLSLEDFNQQVRDYAEQYVKESYVLAEIAKVEKIELSDEEYEQMTSDSLEEYGYESVQQLEEQNGGREKVKQSLLEEKVMKFLRENTTVKK